MSKISKGSIATTAEMIERDRQIFLVYASLFKPELCEHLYENVFRRFEKQIRAGQGEISGLNEAVASWASAYNLGYEWVYEAAIYTLQFTAGVTTPTTRTLPLMLPLGERYWDNPIFHFSYDCTEIFQFEDMGKFEDYITGKFREKLRMHIAPYVNTVSPRRVRAGQKQGKDRHIIWLARRHVCKWTYEMIAEEAGVGNKPNQHDKRGKHTGIGTVKEGLGKVAKEIGIRLSD